MGGVLEYRHGLDEISDYFRRFGASLRSCARRTPLSIGLQSRRKNRADRTADNFPTQSAAHHHIVAAEGQETCRQRLAAQYENKSQRRRGLSQIEMMWRRVIFRSERVQRPSLFCTDDPKSSARSVTSAKCQWCEWQASPRAKQAVSSFQKS
jgi:hypothetical protein